MQGIEVASTGLRERVGETAAEDRHHFAFPKTLMRWQGMDGDGRHKAIPVAIERLDKALCAPIVTHRLTHQLDAIFHCGVTDKAFLPDVIA